MNGCVIPNTPIAVDFWKARECPHVRLFFLTHLHGDHIVGLTSSWNYPIHCSEITGRLLKYKYGLKEELFKILEVDTPTMVFLDKDNKEQMTVTALDANHCPGAVMFLFEGYFGRILHTGDFRYNQQMLLSPPLCVLQGKIDTLYLDNTYCSPGCVFPDRYEATEKIIKIIKLHPNHRVVIAMRTLGKEDLLQTIAIQCDTWISVPPSYFDTLRIIEVQNVFKNNCLDCKIQVVPYYKISNKFIGNLNQQSPTIVIIPTALFCGIDAAPYSNNENVFVVPYSDHSSYKELVTFVSALRPQIIVPIVKSQSRGPFGIDIADRSDMTCFHKYLSKSEKRHVIVPISVKSFMEDYQADIVTCGKLTQSKKRRIKPKINRKQVKKGIIYQSPKKLSDNVLSTQNNNLPLHTKTLNLHVPRWTHRDNWDIKENEVLIVTAKQQDAGYHSARNLSHDSKENGEKNQNKISATEKHGDLDHCKISSAACTTATSVVMKKLVEKSESETGDSGNLALSSEHDNVNDEITEINNFGRELSDDDIFAIPETPINVNNDDAGSLDDLEKEAVTCLFCDAEQSDFLCDIKSRLGVGACHQSVYSEDDTGNCKVLFHHHLPKERPVPKDSSQLYENTDRIMQSVLERPRHINTFEYSEKGKDCRNKAMLTSLPNETGISSLDVLQSSRYGNIIDVDMQIKAYLYCKATENSSTTDSHEQLAVRSEFRKETDKEGYVCGLLDGAFADKYTFSFNFVSVVARKKCFRRQRLYRNLIDGIQKK